MSSGSSTTDPSILVSSIYEDPSHEIGAAAAMSTDSDSSRSNLNSIFSPVRKKIRNEDPIHDLNSCADVDDTQTKDSTSIVDFCSQRYFYSQDNPLNTYSQGTSMSQDGNLFTSMSLLNVASSQQSYADNVDNYYTGLANQSSNNHSNFSLPFSTSNASQSLFNHGNPCSNIGIEKDNNKQGLMIRNEPVDKKSERVSMNRSNPVGSSSETEREINIPTPIRNVFVKGAQSHQERYFEQHIKATSRVKKPSKIWIGAFQERPRVVIEYEEIKRLGELKSGRDGCDGC